MPLFWGPETSENCSKKSGLRRLAGQEALYWAFYARNGIRIANGGFQSAISAPGRDHQNRYCYYNITIIWGSVALPWALQALRPGGLGGFARSENLDVSWISFGRLPEGPESSGTRFGTPNYNSKPLFCTFLAPSFVIFHFALDFGRF